jgi:hypothetical protein
MPIKEQKLLLDFRKPLEPLTFLHNLHAACYRYFFRFQFANVGTGWSDEIRTNYIF